MKKVTETTAEERLRRLIRAAEILIANLTDAGENTGADGREFKDVRRLRIETKRADKYLRSKGANL